MVERIANGGFDDTGGFRCGELVFGLALKFRLADKDREHCRACYHHVIGCDVGGAFGLANALGMVF